MKRIVGGLAALVLALAGGTGMAAESPGVQVEKLMESGASWDGRPYVAYPSGAPMLTVLRIAIPAHSALPWHTHPIPNAAYVLSGELTVEKKETGETRLLKQGDVLPEMVGEYHRGVTGDQGVVLIVFYAGSRGLPLSQQ